MSELMDRGIIGMPFEMAMSNELSRTQFYGRAQALFTECEQLRTQVDTLRGLLQESVDLNNHHSITDLTDPVRVRIEAALAQHPELATSNSSEVVTGGGMDSRIGQGVPPPALDERIPTAKDYMAARSAIEACDWSGVPLGNKAILRRAMDLLCHAAHPAQTEQQPVVWATHPKGASVDADCGFVGEEEAKNYAPGCVTPLYAAPIAQTAPQPEQTALAVQLYPLLVEWKPKSRKEMDAKNTAAMKVMAALSAQGEKP